MQFEVRAFSGGRISSVRVDAVSAADALRQVTSATQKAISARAVGASRTRRSFSATLFAQELLALLEAGLSIIEAVDTLGEREQRPAARSVMSQVGLCLREGRTLSGALESVPEAFPALLVGIVRAAERTGDLPQALGRYIDYRQRADALRGKVVSACIYPAILLAVGAAVTLFLGGYVIPQFAKVYQGTGRSLPWASALLLQWGTLVRLHWQALLPSVALGLLAVVIGVRQVIRKHGVDALLKAWPGLAERLRTYELARLYLTLGMLLDSGLPITQALALAGASAPLHVQRAMRAADERIRQGERLSRAFDACGLTTAIGLRMLRIGEESGRQGEMMMRAARFHDDETTRELERFSKVAEPLLMVAIGIVVGTIVILLYLPIFDLAGSLQ